MNNQDKMYCHRIS